ncbi:hypothetical protein [Kitasatospora sp. NPDC091207]|uniref:hypothetical protein n=1 Tax=Kitasatospora sp. NPDC091207 TaxID=3364083 RepID=UPI00382A1E3F
MSDTQARFAVTAGPAATVTAGTVTTAVTAGGRLAAVGPDAVPPRRRPAPIAALRRADALGPADALRPGEDQDGDEPSTAAARSSRGRAAHCRIALHYLD